jgi:hypothetical protein
LQRRFIFPIANKARFASIGKWVWAAVFLTTELKRIGALDGMRRVVEIGSQQLADSFLTDAKLLDELYTLFGACRVDLGRPCGEANFTRKAPPSRPFWTSFGFELTDRL